MEPEEEEEEITEEQRKRAEANRVAALSKRKAVVANDAPNEFQSAWKLFKCRKLSSEPINAAFPKPIYPIVKIDSIRKPELPSLSTEKFRVRLEICSPDSFSVTPEPFSGFPYPGDEACFEKLSDLLSNVVPSHYTQNNGGKACVYKLCEYGMVLRSWKNSKCIEYEEIPWGTFNVVETMSRSYATGKWMPCRPEHLPDEKVEELIENIPIVLLNALLPFQIEGVRFGLRRGGRCLIADEMGLGKTLQAIAIASCFMHEGSVLIVCPAILRFSWAEELERWLPLCLPSDIHLVFRHQDNPANLTKRPRIVVISYTMLSHLRRSMLEREWATLIIDESHHLRCTKKTSEPKEIESVLSVAMKVKHLILLSGTPSLSRPMLLGLTKYEFAKTYCSVKHVRGSQGKVFQDFSKGVRLEELNVLLKQTVMIRRLKQHVLAELPPIRRQIIRLVLKRSDIASANAGDAFPADGTVDKPFEVPAKAKDKNVDQENLKKLGDQALGLAKVSGFLDWLSLHPIIADCDCEEAAKESLNSQKMIIFGHHHKVLDKVEEFICEKGIKYIRIDARVDEDGRKEAVNDFQSSNKVKIAIIGILAGGCGLNLTAAEYVVFLELPKEISNLQQAEGRAHRIGQAKRVNVYVFCAKDSNDESRWKKLNESLFRVSSMMNGKYEAVDEIKVDTVSSLETTGRAEERKDELVLDREANREVSSESLTIPQNCCYSRDQWPLQEYHDSNEIANERIGTHKEAGTISSKTPSRQSEGILRLGYGCSSPKATSVTAVRISLHNQESETVVQKEKVNIVDGMDKSDRGPFEPNAVDAGSYIHINFLRFEVSQYTGRVHLYSCIPGIDSRPRPLFQSFRPEELESKDHLAEQVKKVAGKCTEDNPNYQFAVMTFMNQWKKLRPIEQKKLMLKPLQLPLSIELCYLDECRNHDRGGLLKGRSKRRSTPLHEISHPLPSDVAWRKVHLFSGYGKKERIYTQGWSAMDEPLCKLCQNPCKSDNAKKPEFFEDLFCNLGCYEEYHLRTSNRSLRKALFEIERGICTNCQLDCHKLVEHLRPLSYEKRQEHIKKMAPKLATRKKLFDKLIKDPADGNAWHADHLVPVYQGGGECRLENMRTLCIVCHADVTAKQCAERRLTKAKAKSQLKVILNDLKYAQKPEGTSGNIKDHQQVKTEENQAEEELLVEVPGSAYSGAKDMTTGD